MGQTRPLFVYFGPSQTQILQKNLRLQRDSNSGRRSKVFTAENKKSVAAIAQWIRLRLPSCSPGFKSQSQHQRFFQFIIKLRCGMDANKQKRDRDGPIF